jgi:hypothetical protein
MPTSRVKYFLDTEFIESGPYKPIQLISIGIVCEDTRTLYRVSSEFDPATANDWVRENVLPNVGFSVPVSLKQIAADIIKFVTNDEYALSKPEFWGYYADYDWVVFCQIFGSMIDLPKGWPMYCRDIKQMCDSVGNPKLPDQKSKEHNALFDALWNKLAYDFLSEID